VPFIENDVVMCPIIDKSASFVYSYCFAELQK